MAVNARFVADFSSFFSAVQKAEVELKGLETGAARVEKSLNKMVDDFGGRKLIQDATLIAEAVNRIGGASTLTAREQQKVNALVTEAIAKYKALGQEAPKALTDLATATGQVAKNTEQMKAPADAAGVSFKQLFGAFSLANIATSAVSSLTSEITELATKGLKLPAVEASFERLAMGVGESSEAMLTSLQVATKGMVSEFDLMQTANKALLLGLPVTEESLGEMAQAATALGRAMGQDATKSLDDLITALGRSSPMILDNLGLTVKLGDANEAMAQKLGKSVSELTEAEKKIAFYEAAMEAARKKTKELGEQTETLTEIMARAWTSIGNQVTRAAGDFNVGVGRMLSDWQRFKQAIEGSGGTPAGAIMAAAAQEKFEQLDRALKQSILANPPKGFGEIPGLPVTIKSLDELKSVEEELAKTFAKTQKQIEQSLREEQRRLDESTRFWGNYARAQKEAIAANEAMFRSFSAEMIRDSFLGEKGRQALHDNVDETIKWIKTWTQFETGLASIEKELLKVSETGVKAQDSVADAARRARVEFEQQQDAVFFLADAFDQFGSVAEGVFGNILRDVGNIINAFGRAGDAAQLMRNGLSRGGVTGAIDVASGLLGGASSVWQATGQGSQGARAAGGALTGAKFGAAFGPWGAAIGAAAGAITGWIRGMNQGRKAVKEFAESFGGFDQLHRQLAMLGKEGEQLWVKLTQGVGNNNPQQAAQVINEIQTALADAPRRLNEMVAAAVTGGAQIDAAMVPFIEDLIRTGQLTEENANLLLGLPARGVPAFAAVEAAAEALGLDINALGENIQQLGFTESVDAIAKHLDVLERAGADMDAVFTGSREKLQKIVDDAQRMGRSLPESIKPFLQQMVDAGKLTDLFGNKLEDLDDLHFTKPLEKSVEDLIEALHELVGVIRDDVGGALDDLGNRVVRPRIEINNPGFAPRMPGSVDDPTFGGRIPVGPVGPFDLGPEQIAAMSRTASMTVHVHTHMDSRQIGEEIVPVIPEIVERFGAYQ